MRPHEIEQRLLLGPGPSPVEPRILEALARPTVGHLDAQLLTLMDEVQEGLRGVFGTVNPMTFALSATGSAGMEAALANVIEPGDVAVIGINGVFGTRLAEMARRMGADVVGIEASWGAPISETRFLDEVRRQPRARVAALVHAETSTGVWQPLAAVGEALAGTDTLFLVDAVTSLGGIPVNVDRHHIDVCYSGTQKCLGVPPGLAPITFSEKAMRRIEARTRPCQSWYFDVELIAGYLGEQRRYHHTAPINMLYALREALAIVDEEGLEQRFQRHLDTGQRLQEALAERGFDLFAQEGHRLPQLTAAALPGGQPEGPLRQELLERFGIEVGGGLGPSQGKIWRVGLMGYGARPEVVDALLEAVDTLLVGAPV